MELQCPQCAKRLRVPDEAAGKAVRCPSCQAVVNVSNNVAETPMAGPRAPAPRAMASQQWTVKTEDGQEYGPISKAELDTWVSEGRLGPQCQLLATGAAQWQWASDVYPQLGSAAAPAPPMRGSSPGAPDINVNQPSSAPFVVADNPYASPQSGPYNSGGQSHMRARRIPNHLGLAIFSLICCGGVFAIPAIIYASQANSLKAQGDYQGAARAAKSAETWLYVAIGIGIVGGILSALLQVAVHSQ